MYYICSENKDADELRDYREADLRLCFRICKKPVFSRRGSNFIAFRLRAVFNYAYSKTMELKLLTARLFYVIQTVCCCCHVEVWASAQTRNKPGF